MASPLATRTATPTDMTMPWLSYPTTTTRKPPPTDDGWNSNNEGDDDADDDYGYDEW